MLYKGVDIFMCKFFTVSKPEDKSHGLKFYKGTYKGQSVDDFNTIESIKKVIAYCFWIVRKGDIPVYSKFAAMSFINELGPKMRQLEMKIAETAIEEQERLKKETKDSIKVSGTKYSNR